MGSVTYVVIWKEPNYVYQIYQAMMELIWEKYR